MVDNFSDLQTKAIKPAADSSANKIEVGKTDRSAMLEEVGRSEIGAREARIREGTNSPVELMKLYFSGKLSAEQLAFELKIYNSVAADTLIRQGKHATTKAVDFKDTRVADYGDQKKGRAEHDPEKMKEEHDKHAPTAKTAGGAKAQAAYSKDDNKKHEAERTEKQLKQREQQNIVLQTTIFNKTQEEQSSAQHWRDIKHKEDLQKEEEASAIDPNMTAVEKVQKLSSPKGNNERQKMQTKKKEEAKEGARGEDR
jgi:phage protein D